MNTRLLASTLLLTAIGFGASAQTVSQQDAAAKAISFLNQGPRHARSTSEVSEGQLELAYKAAKGNETYYYIFNDRQSGAFVIVAGDERATEILGYGDHGCMDIEQAPANFRWWMSQYEAQIHAAIQQGMQPASARKAAPRLAPGRPSVPELVKTKWNQNAPYNSQIPSLGDTYTGNYALATGCVATAMAQVINKHRNTKGAGSNSYTGINGLTFAANFGATTYDWANMLDEYKEGQYSQAQGQAVATLMYHCGVSVDMKYGQIISGGSSASSSDIPHALTTYFGYDKSAQRVERKYYTDDEWLDLIYDELAAGRPVLYSGQDAYSDSGHEFVCHGYDASANTFAINWGWGGSNDGYFTLIGVDGLQPDGSGIGGAAEGASYTCDQNIIINAMPDKGTAKTPLIMYCNIDAGRRVTLTNGSGNQVQSPTIDLTQPKQTFRLSFYPWNYSGDTRSFETSVMFRDVISGACFYASDKNESYTLEHTFLTEQVVEFSSAEFEMNGIYEVLPVVREAGETEWQRLRYPTTVAIHTVSIVGGKSAEQKDITFAISSTTVEERSTLSITHDKLYNGNITYSATPAGIVSIDANGVVTALKVGSATITVTGEETVYFNHTSQTFNVTVTPYVKVPVMFMIDETELSPGDFAHITIDANNYVGTITYQSSDESVATVDAQGKVTAVSEGVVTITAHADEDELYKETSKTFNIQVAASDFPLTEVLVKNKGYVTPDDAELTFSVKNKSNKNYSQYPFGISAIIGRFSFSRSEYIYNFCKGDIGELTFDIANCSIDFGGAGTYSGYTMLNENIGKDITVTIIDGSNRQALKPTTLSVITMHVVQQLTITYTLSAAGWGTLCLPFEAEVPENLTAYKVTGVKGKYLIKEEVDYLQMNTPYLLTGTPGNYTFSGPDTPEGSAWPGGIMVGNTQPSAYAPAGSYVLQVQDGELGFYKVAKDNTLSIRQYSAYLQLPSGNASTYFAIHTPASIEQMADSEAVGASYQINGMRINGQAKGLVVKNGRIMFNK